MQAGPEDPACICRASWSDKKAMEWFRRGEFQRYWTRNFLFFFLPAFVVFATGIVIESNRVALMGWVICVVAMVRGARIIWKYKRCESCGHVNFRHPLNENCRRCGASLPGDEDMTVF
jgi:hypothetical protein